VLSVVKQVVFPTRERLLAKIADLNERIDLIEAARSAEIDRIEAGLRQELLIAAGRRVPLANPSHGQTIDIIEAGGPTDSTLLRNCRENVKKAEECIDARRVFSDPHLAWRYLHHDDEDLMLVMPLDELRARAVEVKALFKLNIKEEAVRAEWLGAEGGEKGSLSKAVEKLHDSAATAKEVVACRHVVRQALRQVNEQVDRGYWSLSMNVFTSVASAALLGGLMFAFWYYGFLAMIPRLGKPDLTPGGEWATASLTGFLAMVLLGAMGAYLGNFITKQEFLFVRGGPFLRYLLSPVLARGIVGGFAAAFVFLIEQSGLFFTLGAAPLTPSSASSTLSSTATTLSGAPATLSSLPGAAGGATAVASEFIGPARDRPEKSDRVANALVNFNTPPASRGYALAILAIVSGFAAEKVLGGMIGSVQRRLMEKAEKTTETPSATSA
jgi:hypothetical protein